MRSNQYPRFIRSGDRLSSTPCDRINIGDLSDRAIYPIEQFIRSGDRQICTQETAQPFPECRFLTKYTIQAVSVAKPSQGVYLPAAFFISHKLSVNTDLYTPETQKLKYSQQKIAPPSCFFAS
jgi:hypothetical protein